MCVNIYFTLFLHLYTLFTLFYDTCLYLLDLFDCTCFWTCFNCLYFNPHLHTLVARVYYTVSYVHVLVTTSFHIVYRLYTQFSHSFKHIHLLILVSTCSHTCSTCCTCLTLVIFLIHDETLLVSTCLNYKNREHGTTCAS